MSRRTKPKPAHPTYVVVGFGTWLRQDKPSTDAVIAARGQIVTAVGQRPPHAEHPDVVRSKRNDMRRKLRRAGVTS